MGSRSFGCLITAWLLTLPAVSAAQQPSGTSWDFSGTTGLFTAQVREQYRQPYDQWSHAAQAAIAVGRYLTPHFKVEAELAANTVGRQSIFRTIVVPGIVPPVYVSGEALTRTQSAAATAVWQFFDNDWVHPFVTAGVTIDRERVNAEYPPQRWFTATGTAVAPQLPNEASSSVVARARLGAGAKFYLRERVFIRTDAQVALGTPGHHLALRIGAGFDFGRR